MSCSNNFKKSAVSTVNTAAQTVTATATPLSLLGSVCYNSGCSLSANASGINIKSSGLYTASGSVTITPTAAGSVTVYLALNGVTLPCSVRQQTVAAASPITINTSAIAFGAGACACNTSTLTLVVSGAAGTVDYVTAGAVRLA